MDLQKAGLTQDTNFPKFPVIYVYTIYEHPDHISSIRPKGFSFSAHLKLLKGFKSHTQNGKLMNGIHRKTQRNENTIKREHHFNINRM